MSRYLLFVGPAIRSMANSRSESDTLIKNIVPRLKEMGWDESRMEFEKTCGAGQIDLLYVDERGRALAVVEAKKPKTPKKNIKKALETQAIPYAKSVRAPIAIVWDGVAQLATQHIKKQTPLLDYDGNALSHSNVQLLQEGNLTFFRKNNSLNVKIKSGNEIEEIFRKLNRLGRNIGLTVGVERVTEIAKILFIKMLCDNEKYISTEDWNQFKGTGGDRIVHSLNHLIKILKDEGIDIPELTISKSKGREVWEIIELLETVNFNNRFYGDVTGSLFEHFLSSRAKASNTNDLGQYFTPKNIDELIYELSQYNEGEHVYDPFCGTGGILLEFFRKQISKTMNKSNFAMEYLYGSELSKPVSLLAKMNMVIAGDGHTNIHDIDSLSCRNPLVENRRKFDVIATNMPFAPHVPNDVPENYFSMAHDSNDVAKFVEHCVNSCKVGGRVVLIVGKGFLTEVAVTEFRRRLLRKHTIEAIYTLYGGVFRPYTGAHSVILVLTKGTRQQKEHIDFFAIGDDDDIKTAKQYHNADDRYDHKFYKVNIAEILESDCCDLRGDIYRKDDGMTVGDLVDYVEKVKIENPQGCKMTTPNHINDGMYLINSQPKKRVESGKDSFCYKIVKGAIVVARIVGQRKAGKYLGSALAEKDEGNLITAEYHQFIPKNPDDRYFILNWFRSRPFQRIVGAAKGTGGQQRIGQELILNASIPIPTDELRKEAYEQLIEIEAQRIDAITRKMTDIDKDMKNTQRIQR